MLSGPGTTALTGQQCSPNHVHWSWDTYVLANTSGSALAKQGATSGIPWRPTTLLVSSSQRTGRRRLRRWRYSAGQRSDPFPGTSDFSARSLQAQASGAKVLALCNGGADMVASVKQAREFGLNQTMTIVSLLLYDTYSRDRAGGRAGADGDANLLLGSERAHARLQRKPAPFGRTWQTPASIPARCITLRQLPIWTLHRQRMTVQRLSRG